MELGILRDEIDEIDGKIVDLYEKRMDICKQVAEYKIETGKKVFDRTREEEKIRKVKSQTHNEFNSHGVEELFEQIMSMSRKLQYQMLAEKGSIGKLPFIGVDELDTQKARTVFSTDVDEPETSVPETGRGRSIRAVTVYSDSFPG